MNKNKNRRRNNKDEEKAAVKYNYKDFVNASPFITEKCEELVKGLCTGAIECVIC